MFLCIAPHQCLVAIPAQHDVLAAEEGFVVTSKGGKVFDDVDLSEDWSEWDEKINESIGIYSVEAKFELHKGK
jgi:hypothetical protein